ncbi:hypothetical protein EYF80_056522 [Liparis tanakae]|uniref:Uncharacterized protein n=1 Tax=Liparis tanakae TaxID=230148 RepID=A0A4Z2EWP3_9TELE|nr:hypothetical protein EYF80_056522 [Liparis tanakae]
METDMLGPFTITGISEKVVHLAKDQSTTVANIDQLTPFNQPEDRIPAGLAKVSSCPTPDPPPQQPPASLSSPNQHAANPPPATSEGNQPIHDREQRTVNETQRQKYSKAEHLLVAPAPSGKRAAGVGQPPNLRRVCGVSAATATCLRRLRRVAAQQRQANGESPFNSGKRVSLAGKLTS